MTPRQRLFVAEYLVDLNGKEAAIRAGYRAAGAAVRAAKILANPVVAAALAEAQAALAQRTGVTASRVIGEYSKIAFFDPRTIARDDGESLAMLPSSRVPADGAAAIGALAEYRVKGQTCVRVTPFDKLGALNSLGRILGVFGGKGVDVARLNDGAAAVAPPVARENLEPLSARQRRFADAYLVDFNGGNAARRAGYATGSAPYQATRLLQYPGIAARIAAGMEKRLADPRARADRAIAAYAAIAFADMKRVARWTDRRITLLARRDIGAADAAAIERIEAPPGEPVRIRLHDKKYTLDRLAMHLGLLRPTTPGRVSGRQLPEQKAAALLRARIKALGI